MTQPKTIQIGGTEYTIQPKTDPKALTFVEAMNTALARAISEIRIPSLTIPAMTITIPGIANQPRPVKPRCPICHDNR